MIIQILSLDMRKALKTALIPPGPDFCTQLHHAHIAVVSYENFFEILGSTLENILDNELRVATLGRPKRKYWNFFFTFQGNEK